MGGLGEDTEFSKLVERCITSGSDTFGFVLMTRHIPEGIARANVFFFSFAVYGQTVFLCTFFVL